MELVSPLDSFDVDCKHFTNLVSVFVVQEHIQFPSISAFGMSIDSRMRMPINFKYTVLTFEEFVIQSLSPSPIGYFSNFFIAITLRIFTVFISIVDQVFVEFI